MVATYCTVVQVVAQLGLVDKDGVRMVLTTTSVPSIAEVTELIEDAEGYIDNYTATSWKTGTITDERHSFSLNNTYFRSILRGNGFYVQLGKRFVTSMTKIELWQGAAPYKDIVATGTEGTGQQEGDWFLEGDEGLLWINTQLPTFGEGTIKVTYTFKRESTVPTTIRRASILLAAALLIESGFDYNNITIGNDMSMDNQAKAEAWEERAKRLLETEIVPYPIQQR